MMHSKSLWCTVKVYDAQQKFMMHSKSFWCTAKVFDAQQKFVMHRKNLWCTAKVYDAQQKFTIHSKSLWYGNLYIGSHDTAAETFPPFFFCFGNFCFCHEKPFSFALKKGDRQTKIIFDYGNIILEFPPKFRTFYEISDGFGNFGLENDSKSERQFKSKA